ncbi:MAG TPA: hypothetical protein DD377_00885 [Firmicutes bacterium]|nr:hypothetical protein [Bacillota bacterium]
MNKINFLFAFSFLLILPSCSENSFESSLTKDSSGLSSDLGTSFIQESSSLSSSFLESSFSEDSSSLSSSSIESSFDSSSKIESISSESTFFENEKNPDGSPKLAAPSNYSNPKDYSSSYFNFDVSSYTGKPLEGGFSLIYGNSKYDTPSFRKYENNEDNPKVNGLKMDYFDPNSQGRSYIGLQSPYMVSNKKIEFRFKVSGVHGTQKKNGNDKNPLFTIYSYNEDCSLVSTSKYFNDEYGKSILNSNEIKLYITPATEIRYFELRFNQAPYSSSKQCFSFNISSLTLRQWEYE